MKENGDAPERDWVTETLTGPEIELLQKTINTTADLVSTLRDLDNVMGVKEEWVAKTKVQNIIMELNTFIKDDLGGLFKALKV